MAAEQTTSKKVKVIGTQTYINATTGELEDMQVQSIEDRDFNFTKIWMKNLIATMELVGNQKTKLAYWIIDNLNKENQLIITYRKMSEETKISIETVRMTMKILLDADFLRKIQNGVYIVNPDIVFKGTRGARLNVLNIYQNEAQHITMTDDEKIKNYRSSIKYLEEKIKKLEMKKAIQAADGNYYVEQSLPLDEDDIAQQDKATKPEIQKQAS